MFCLIENYESDDGDNDRPITSSAKVMESLMVELSHKAPSAKMQVTAILRCTVMWSVHIYQRGVSRLHPHEETTGLYHRNGHEDDQEIHQTLG